MNHGKLALVNSCGSVHNFGISAVKRSQSASTSGSVSTSTHGTSLPEAYELDIYEDNLSILPAEYTDSRNSSFTVQQPCYPFTSAGVVKLTSRSSNDHLLELLTSTYLKTRRDSNHKKRVTIIDQQGLTESYEFSNREVYWQFISSVTRAAQGVPVSFCSHFMITQSEFIAGGGGGKGKCDIAVSFAIRGGALHYLLPKLSLIHI